MTIEKPASASRQKQIVRNGGNLLGFPPRTLQQPELALERPALLCLVESHLEGELDRARQLYKVPRNPSICVLFAAFGDLGQESLGVLLKLNLLDRVLDRAPGCSRTIDQRQNRVEGTPGVVTLEPIRPPVE